MAKYSNTVEYNIKTTLDKTGIIKLQSQLVQLEQHFSAMGKQKLLSDKSVNEALGDIKIIQQSLQSAFNGKLGMLDNKAFLKSLISTKNEMTGTVRSLNNFYNSLSAGGAKGVQAFTQMYGQIGKIDTGLKQISSTTDKIINTFGNTVRWGLIASAFANVMNSAHQSVEYVKELDTSLTNIMMVSGETKNNMNEFAQLANQVAQRLGATTIQMTEATKVFVQQGMNTQQSLQMGEYAVHLANISEQDSATTSDELTAMKNAFKIDIDDMGNAISKWAVIANNTAVDMEELSVASQKAASVANTVGVDMEQFAGHIAAIEATTREAPENIGNGLKTLYSRLADIKLGETLEDGVDLGQFSSALKKVGVDVLDTSGKMRDVGTIVEDLMNKWQDLDQTQRNAVATTVAGRFQLARFEALMNSSDIYRTAMTAAKNEQGTETYDRMQETYRESIEGRSKALQASIERIFMEAFNTEDFYGFIDAITKATDALGTLIESIGGGSTALTGLAGILTKSFSNAIGRGVSNFISNRQSNTLARENAESARINAQNQIAGIGLNVANSDVQRFVNDTAVINQYAPIMNAEQIEKANALFKEREQILLGLTEAEENYRNIQIGLTGAFEALGVSAEAAEMGLQPFLNELKAAGTDGEVLRKALETSGFSKFIDSVHNAQTGLASLTDQLDKMATSGEADWEKLQNAAAPLKNEIQNIKNSMKNLPSSFQGNLSILESTLKNLDIIIDGDVESLEQLSVQFKEGTFSLNDFRQGLSTLLEIGEITPERFMEINAQLAAFSAQADNASQRARGMAESLRTQELASEMASLASGVMNIAFAIQSLSNLGNIINNEDLTIAEKALEITINLGMAISMLAMGIPGTVTAVQTLSKALQAWAFANGALAISENAVTAAQVSQVVITKLSNTTYGRKVLAIAAMITGNEALAASETEVGVAALFAEGAMAPLVALAAPIIAVAAAVGAVVAAINYFSEQEERRKEVLEASVEASNKSVEAIKENKATLDSLYKSYEKTKEASDEFKNALLEQADVLGIINAEQMVALGQYEELKKKIDEVTQSQLIYNTSLLQQQNKELGAGTAMIDHSYYDAYGNYYQGDVSSGYQDLLRKQEAVREKQDEIVQKQNELTQATLRTVDETYTQEQKNQDIFAIQNELNALEEQRLHLSQQITEENQQALENAEKIKENQLFMAVNNESIVGSLNSIDDIRAILENGSLGPELTQWFKEQAQQDQDAYIYEFIDGIVNSGLETQLTEEFGRAFSAASLAAQEYAKNQEKLGNDYDSAYADMMSILSDLDEELSDRARVTLIAELDMTQSKEEIQEDLAELSEEDFAKLEIRAEVTADKEALQPALESLLKDEELGADQLRDLFNDNINVAFEGASGQSAAFADAMTLLVDKTYDGETALINLEGALEDIEHNYALEDLLERGEEAADGFNIADNAAQHLADTLEDDAFNLTIDIGGDLIDQADAIMEAMGDVSTLTGKIGEGFLVAAEDAKALERAFPGILENYQITANGMIQLDQEIAQSAMGVATTDMQSSAEAQATKLNNYADYADAMSEIYMQEAIEMAEKAAQDVATEEEANQYIAKSELDLQKTETQLMQEHDIAARTTANNEASYMGQASQVIASTQRQAAQSAGTSLSGIAQAAATVAGNIAHNFLEVARTIGAALTGQQYSASFVGLTAGLSTGGDITFGNIQSGQSINIGGQNYTVGQGEGSIALANKAAEYQAKAFGLKQAAGQARATAAGIQAKGQETQSNINKAGSPKSSNKSNKEKKPKEEKEETPKNISYTEVGKEELDIYKKIDAWLNKLQDDYSRLNKVREKTWSKDRLKIINSELGVLKTQREALKDRIKISQDYLEVLEKGTKAQKEAYGISTTLTEVGLTDADKDGVVDNYKEQWQVATSKAQKWQDKAKDFYESHGGKLDDYGNVVKEAQMLGKDAQKYKNLTETAKNYLNIAKQISDVTSKYESTWNEIRDDNEKVLDILYQITDIQIEAYKTSIDQLDTLKDMHDIMVSMVGMWSKFTLDSPFRALVEDIKEVKDLFNDPAYDPAAYYDNIITTLEDRQKKATKAEQASYTEAIAWYEKQKDNASKNLDGLGSGEIAQASRRLAELQRWMDNPYSADNPYAVYDAINKKYLVDTKALETEFETVYKKVTELALEAEKAWDKAQKHIVEALDEELDKLNKLYNKYDDIANRLERESDRISLFHGEDQYDDLSKLADQAGKVQLVKAKKYQQEYKHWEDKQKAIQSQEEIERTRRLNEAKAIIETKTGKLSSEATKAFNEASAKKTRKESEAALNEWIKNYGASLDKENLLVLEQANQYHSEEWGWYEEKMRDAQENVLDAQDKAAESFKKAYEYALNEIEAKFLESALGTRDTNYLQDDWNRDKDYMTTYKDDFERNYEVQKLNYKWQNMLNDALGASLVTQRKIRNEGQAIVDQLANQVTMSEYDVKLANARLEILQKQIALENAQQNKNQMKLRRDTQGNYKYVYAADQNDVGEKQQDLLDSVYDVWEISKEQKIASYDDLINLATNYAEQLKAIDSDLSLTEAEKIAWREKLAEDFNRKLQAIREDTQDSFEGMISAVVLGTGIGLENVQEMCANVLEALETHNETAIEAIGVPWDDELESKLNDIQGIENAFKDMMNSNIDATNYFLNEIKGPNGVGAITGEEYGKAEDVIKNTDDATNNLYNETLKLYTLFGLESKALEQAKETMEEYRDALDAATSNSGAFADQIRKANDTIVANAQASGNWITNTEKASSTAEGSKNAKAISTHKVETEYVETKRSTASANAAPGTVGSGGSFAPTSSFSSGSGSGVTTSGTTSSKSSEPHDWMWIVQDENGVAKTQKAGTYGAAVKIANETPGLDNYTIKQVRRYATGGYTGSWSDGGIDEKDGKWAILHQKELVLNAYDTKNILAAVELVRQSTDLLKNASLSDALFKNQDSIGHNLGQQDAIISQPVTISAEFPNANSVTEIKEALLSLTDAASQYAYRVNGASSNDGRVSQRLG